MNMSIILWIVVVAILGVAAYALVLVTFPLVYKEWEIESEDEYAEAHLKRRLSSGDIDVVKFKAMVAMHRKTGHCDYC